MENMAEAQAAARDIAQLSGARRKRWSGQVGHPRAFLSSLRDRLEDEGFRIPASGFSDSPTSISDVSYVDGALVAVKEREFWEPWKLTLGVLALPLIVGIFILMNARSARRAVVAMEMEGEAYLSGDQRSAAEGAGAQSATAHREQKGVFGEVRATLRWASGAPSGEGWGLRHSDAGDPWGLDDTIKRVVAEASSLSPEEAFSRLEAPSPAAEGTRAIESSQDSREIVPLSEQEGPPARRER